MAESNPSGRLEGYTSEPNLLGQTAGLAMVLGAALFLRNALRVARPFVLVDGRSAA